MRTLLCGLVQNAAKQSQGKNHKIMFLLMKFILQFPRVYTTNFQKSSNFKEKFDGGRVRVKMLNVFT